MCVCVCCQLVFVKDGAGTEPALQTAAVGTFFHEGPEPSELCFKNRNQNRNCAIPLTFPVQRNRQNRKLERSSRSMSKTVTEPN